MKWGHLFALAGRLIHREWRSGELSVLVFALLVAVSAMSSVSFFSDRIEGGLKSKAGQLLAADFVVNSRNPLNAEFTEHADTLALKSAQTVTFPSMVMGADKAVLASIKAVSEHYPLRGEVDVQTKTKLNLKQATGPKVGEVWVDVRLQNELNLSIGQQVVVGQAKLLVSAILNAEPDGTLDMYSFVPRLMMHTEDLAQTQLIQEGSRIRYRYLWASDQAKVVEDFAKWVKPRIQEGMRIENVEEGRPEIKNALDRARRFLGMTSMLTVALSAAAVALAARRYVLRHAKSVAMMRTLGASSGEIAVLFTCVLLLLGLLSGLLGSLLGYGIQALLIQTVSQWLGFSIPAPSLTGWFLGVGSALILLLGFALPSLMSLRKVSPSLVLREVAVLPSSGRITPLISVSILLGLMAWQIQDANLAIGLLGGLACFAVWVALVSWSVLKALGWSTWKKFLLIRLSLANLSRKYALTLLQLLAISTGILSILLLTVVRDDLLNAWQKATPPDAPNTFALNIQHDQQDAWAQYFKQINKPVPALSPMVRARLVSINQTEINEDSYTDPDAKRMALREFNLSWSDTLPKSNQVLAGTWWSQNSGVMEYSIEEGIAKTLGIKLGDVVSFEIVGEVYKAKVTSIRKVSWDSMQVNFFVMASPGLLSKLESSYISSFHLDSPLQMNQLAKIFSNVTLIDTSLILKEVRSVVDRLSVAIEWMFILAFIAGALVLWATLVTTQDERKREMALMRALGASRGQIRGVVLFELSLIGILAGLSAGLAAMLMGALLLTLIFNLEFHLNFSLLWMSFGMAGIVVGFAALPLIHQVMNTSPTQVLKGD